MALFFAILSFRDNMGTINHFRHFSSDRLFCWSSIIQRRYRRPVWFEQIRLRELGFQSGRYRRYRYFVVKFLEKILRWNRDGNLAVRRRLCGEYSHTNWLVIGRGSTGRPSSIASRIRLIYPPPTWLPTRFKGHGEVSRQPVSSTALSLFAENRRVVTRAERTSRRCV